MIEKVELYQTNDGKLFESEKKAEDYIVDQACLIIEALLNNTARRNASAC